MGFLMFHLKYSQVANGKASLRGLIFGRKNL